MILETNKFVEACKNILFAIDNKNVSLYTETLELKASGTLLKMNVTNREYYVTVTFELAEALENDFSAAVNAELFLKLISKITSPTIEITNEETSIKIVGNGTYKLPIIYNNDVMLELPKIEINNITNTMTIRSDILQSILLHNSKELQRGVIVKPVQSYYYVDELGAITFTSGACVNYFNLEKPIKILLSEKVVKLFKLFKDVDSVNFTIGQDALSDDIIQTKVKFEAGNVVLSAILADNSLITGVPVDAIRNMANKDYPYSSVINREELLQVLNRLMLFNNDKNYGRFEFKNDSISITDWSGENKETINAVNECEVVDPYSAIINMNNLSLILNGCDDMYITICFGDSRALLIKKNTIFDIIPELKVQE